MQVQLELDRLMLKLNQSAGSPNSKIFEIYNMILNDRSFVDEIDQKIMGDALYATAAVKLVCEKYINKFKEMEDPYFKDRAADVKDVAQRLLSKLAHSQVEFFDFSKPVILVADEVTASLLVEIPRTSLKGVISCKGSVNSHAAILARNMGVPAIMNIGESIDEFDDWHDKICRFIFDNFDKITDNEMSYGKAQKLLNMTFKHLYCCKDADNFIAHFKY